MYLWKFWRDTRRYVYTCLILVVCIGGFWLVGLSIFSRSPRGSSDPAFLWAADVGAAFSTGFVCALVMGFVAGSSGIGNDLGRGTADFLLTRPCSRRYFAWAGWIAGIGEVFTLVIISVFLVLGSAALATGPVWRHLPSAVRFEVARQVMDIPLMAATLILMPAVIFGLTYFLTILSQERWRGAMLSAAVVFGYHVLSALLKQVAAVSLPGMNFAGHRDALLKWYLEPRFEIVGWAIVALAFPFAAQVALERLDAMSQLS